MQNRIGFEFLPTSIGSGRVTRITIVPDITRNEFVLFLGNEEYNRNTDLVQLIISTNINLFEMYSNIGISSCEKYDINKEYNLIHGDIINNISKYKKIDGIPCILEIDKFYNITDEINKDNGNPISKPMIRIIYKSEKGEILENNIFTTEDLINNILILDNL